MERTPNKSQHKKLTLEKKILPPLLPGFEPTVFRSRVRRSNQQTIPAPLEDLKKTDKFDAATDLPVQSIKANEMQKTMLLSSYRTLKVTVVRGFTGMV